MTDNIQFNEKTLWRGGPGRGADGRQSYFQNFGSILVRDLSGAFSGKLHVVQYNTQFRILSDGKVARNGDANEVTDATYATLVMAAATDYDAALSGSVTGETASTLAARVKARLDAAAGKGYEALLAAHVDSFSELMGQRPRQRTQAGRQLHRRPGMEGRTAAQRQRDERSGRTVRRAVWRREGHHRLYSSRRDLHLLPQRR